MVAKASGLHGRFLSDAKAAKDEAEGEKANAEERCRNQSVELEKAAAWIRDLESQLVSFQCKLSLLNINAWLEHLFEIIRALFPL